MKHKVFNVILTFLDMTKINEKNLEKALKREKASSGKMTSDSDQKSSMPKETEIGFHQGALNTLVNERNELVKIIQNVEAVMQAHIKRLEELGVKIQGKK